MIRVRDATIGDLEAMLVLGARMRDESTEPYPPIEFEHAQKWLELAVTMPDVFLVALAEDERPIGMLTAVAGPYCFSPKIRTASDLLFVLPECRGGTAAMRLMRRFKEWADKIGSVSDNFGIATGVTPERTGKFFKVMGFRPMEMIYRRDNVYGN